LRILVRLGLFFSLAIAPVATVYAQTLDPYGGYTNLPVSGGATGFFRAGKINNRWVLVTPNGNAFWMRGVYAMTGDNRLDERGSSYNARFGQKYGSARAGWNQANRRLQAWGFNVVGPYSYRMTLPTDTDNAVKMPFVAGPQQAGISGRGHGAGAHKNLYYGLDPSVKLFSYSRGGNFPDVYDPAWKSWVASAYATDRNLAIYKASPHFIGYFSDDTDFLAGFGPGMEFATDPPGKFHWHNGYLVLVTAPTQATNPYSKPANQVYADGKVYAKYALRDFLASKYGTIGSLNAAWGSTYTTFDSDGGWPSGRGLLDENGRLAHAWLGTQEPYALNGASAAVKRDLDDFLFELATTYFSVNRAAFKAVAPNALFFGPTNLGGAGWRAPARGPELKAAGQYLDVVNIGTDGSQGQLDFVAGWAGDVPVAVWEGVTANADSGRWRTAGEPGATWNATSQTQRGQKYQQDVQALLNGVAEPTGSMPFVGLLWWAWTDDISEQRNWGLVSLLDNAYDGKEAVIARGTDQWGYATGGEERNYGDFLGPVIRAHSQVGSALGAGPPAGDTVPPSVAITAPSKSTTVSGIVNVVVAATDNVGIITLRYYLDDGLLAVFSPPTLNFMWDSSSTQDGPHTLTVTATDSGGNTARDTVSVAVLNTTPALTSTTISAPTARYNSNAVITVSVASVAGTPTGTVSLSVDGDPSLTSELSNGLSQFVLTSPSSGDHTLRANYSGQGNFSASSAVGTLHVDGPTTDMDPLFFSSETYTVIESKDSAIISVLRSGQTDRTVTVRYATSDGSAKAEVDYRSTSGTLKFSPGATRQWFRVPIFNNTIKDGARTVTLTLSNPTGGALLGSPSSSVLTILDEDVGSSVQFASANYKVSNRGDYAIIRVVRSGGKSSGMTIDYTTSNGTATAGVDYIGKSGTLTFGAGVTSRTFSIPIIYDRAKEGDGTVVLTLSNPGGGAVLGSVSTAVLTIVNRSSAR
jgi:hypothetical protein